MNFSKKNLDLREIKKFGELASHWWDESGPYKPLHALNVTRISYIKKTLGDHFKKDLSLIDPLKSLEILDVGCGGGLITEPLARLGAQMTGIDPSSENIDVARTHAKAFGLDIQYNTCTLEDLRDEKTYDVILGLEVLEHLPNPQQFIRACYEKLTPNGLIILSTLNRTLQSYLKGIVAAEYLLKWVPKGTHSWSQFLKPSELYQYLKKENFSDISFQGISFSALKNEWYLSDTLEVNYFILAAKN